MASELNMYESQIVEHKMDIDRLQRELQEVKKKYYLQKKKEHNQKLAKKKIHSVSRSRSFLLSRERDRALFHGLGPPIVPATRTDVPRFTGGGFNLSQSQKTNA